MTQSGVGGSKEQCGLSVWRQDGQRQEELKFDQKEQNKNQRWEYQIALHSVFRTRLEGAAFHLADSGKPSEALH